MKAPNPIHVPRLSRVRLATLEGASEAAANILESLAFVDEHDAAHARAVLAALRAHLGRRDAAKILQLVGVAKSKRGVR